ncbi:Zinc finger, RING/FYVE/PHD-type [Artemisia annua]|uniref:RING-type E3 ubiquitin transferase n=1 Tax=Artemisia annua TaxID=35608 RepID=A0A2U1NXZ9_ARTAN|nr:Zinc finger, RING/FYVE/PHD-type [Artemisia annua]
MSSMSSPEFDESHARSDFQRPEHLIFMINTTFPLNPDKQGPLPASKSAIESLQTVMSAPEDEDCPICLTEFGGGEVKEMECKHMFHKECVEKWLGVSATCPVCRYQMPVDESRRVDSDLHDEVGDFITVILFFEWLEGCIRRRAQRETV